jgi:hypothetical protein
MKRMILMPFLVTKLSAMSQWQWLSAAALTES